MRGGVEKLRLPDVSCFRSCESKGNGLGRDFTLTFPQRQWPVVLVDILMW